MKRVLLLLAAFMFIAATTEPASQPTTKPAIYDTPMAACEAYCQKSLIGDGAGVLALGIITNPAYKEACEMGETYVATHTLLEIAITARYLSSPHF